MLVESGSLTIELTTPTCDRRPVYITGNFCNWHPDLEEFRMTMVNPGSYRYQFRRDIELADIIEYKYTRGDWEQVELDSCGLPCASRLADPAVGVVKDHASAWRTAAARKALPIIELLPQVFELPPLSTERRIRILLPGDYHERLDMRYPVLYMPDGQNLLGNESWHGNWKIDESLAKLAENQKQGVIIVAIDHGENPVQDLSPYDNSQFGKGYGKELLQFIAGTLKEHVDTKYRTKTDRLSTGIGGSETSGLLSLYGALMFPQTFGKFMVFSPSLWISPRIYFDVIHFFEPFEMRIYLYASRKYVTDMIDHIDKLRKELETQSYGYSRVKIKLSLDFKGNREGRWREEFPIAFEWLFFENDSD